MLKKFILSQKGKKLVKNEESISFQSAKSFGILFNKDLFKQASIEAIVAELEADKKKVKVMGFSTEKTENEYAVTPKSISLFGKLADEQLESFVSNKFDFLISLNTNEHYCYQYILMKINATCKVGIAGEPNNSIQQLSVLAEDSQAATIRAIMKYIKLLS